MDEEGNIADAGKYMDELDEELDGLEAVLACVRNG
jgi:hypothetical protein